MTKMSPLGTAVARVFKAGEYDHLLMRGEARVQAIAQAQEIVKRDGLPPGAKNRQIKSHYAPDDSTLQGVSFQFQGNPLFLFPNGTIVDFANLRVSTLDQVITAHRDPIGNQMSATPPAIPDTGQTGFHLIVSSRMVDLHYLENIQKLIGRLPPTATKASVFSLNN